MNALRNCLSYAWPLVRKQRGPIRRSSQKTKVRSDLIAVALGPWETYMMSLQSILIWENPKKSSAAILLFNIVYWVFAISQVRVLTAVSTLGLCIYLHHEWVNHIWPEISVASDADIEDWTPLHPKMMSVPELSNYIEKVWRYMQERHTNLLQLRKRKHGNFCILMACLFSFTLIMGHVIPGVLLVYCLLMSMLLLPGFFMHLAPVNSYKWPSKLDTFLFGQKDKKMTSSAGSIENDLAEFMPEEQSNEVQKALEIPFTPSPMSDSNMSLGDASTTDVTPGRPYYLDTSGLSSFMAGMRTDQLPSIEDSTYDDIEETDLSPMLPYAVKEEAGTIVFRSSHFAESSEDDDSFTEGLAFSPRNINSIDSTVAPKQVNIPNPAINMAQSIIQTLGQNVLANFVANSMKGEAVESDSSVLTEDEYEIVPDDVE